MKEYAYKMFNKDLTCTMGRGTYQYRPGVWLEEKEANCVRNGFHCAKNPLDCLSYYGNWDNSQCWLVEIGGDIDEDARDSKVACTRIRLVKRLDLTEFVLEAGKYIISHPELEDNSSARAFFEKLESDSLTVEMHDYGNFEKVGDLPWSLPTTDTNITTEPGDIILYQGNRITIYYDENTWNFTKLAKIKNVTKEELLEVLGEGDVTVSFWLEWSE